MPKKSLRKGSIGLELNHKYGTDVIGAINTEIELVGAVGIFRTTLKATGSNEKDDLNAFEDTSNYGLESISLIDDQIRKNLELFLDTNSEIKELGVEIISKKKHSYQAELIRLDDNGIMFNL